MKQFVLILLLSNVNVVNSAKNVASAFVKLTFLNKLPASFLNNTTAKEVRTKNLESARFPKTHRRVNDRKSYVQDRELGVVENDRWNLGQLVRRHVAVEWRGCGDSQVLSVCVRPHTGSKASSNYVQRFEVLEVGFEAVDIVVADIPTKAHNRDVVSQWSQTGRASKVRSNAFVQKCEGLHLMRLGHFGDGVVVQGSACHIQLQRE